MLSQLKYHPAYARSAEVEKRKMHGLNSSSRSWGVLLSQAYLRAPRSSVHVDTMKGNTPVSRTLNYRTAEAPHRMLLLVTPMKKKKGLQGVWGLFSET
jgi:hypothetical protein